MLHLLLKWILGALALLAVTYLVPGFRVVSLPSALVAVLVIGFLNMTIGLLLKIITFPFAILTLGLLFLVINAFMLMLASKILPRTANREFRRRLHWSVSAGCGARPDRSSALKRIPSSLSRIRSCGGSRRERSIRCRHPAW